MGDTFGTVYEDWAGKCAATLEPSATSGVFTKTPGWLIKASQYSTEHPLDCGRHGTPRNTIPTQRPDSRTSQELACKSTDWVSFLEVLIQMPETSFRL